MEPLHSGTFHQRVKGQAVCLQVPSSFLSLLGPNLLPQGINWATLWSCDIWSLQSRSKEA